MCVAIIVPRDTALPNNFVLQAAARRNPQGGGFAWVDPARKMVAYRKGLTLEELMELADEFRTNFPATDHPPVFIHFRIATAGDAIKELTHPFPITKKASVALSGYVERVLMHNGTWSGWKPTLLRNMHGRLSDEPWSDTRAMAYLAAWHGNTVLDLTEEKVATLDRTGDVTLYGKGWDKLGKLIVSNTHWTSELQKMPDVPIGAVVDIKESCFYVKKGGDGQEYTSFASRPADAKEHIVMGEIDPFLTKEELTALAEKKSWGEWKSGVYQGSGYQSAKESDSENWKSSNYSSSTPTTAPKNSQVGQLEASSTTKPCLVLGSDSESDDDESPGEVRFTLEPALWDEEERKKFLTKMGRVSVKQLSNEEIVNYVCAVDDAKELPEELLNELQNRNLFD
jgi:hypothetical protein